MVSDKLSHAIVCPWHDTLVHFKESRSENRITPSRKALKIHRNHFKSFNILECFFCVCERRFPFWGNFFVFQWFLFESVIIHIRMFRVLDFDIIVWIEIKQLDNVLSNRNFILVCKWFDTLFGLFSGLYLALIEKNGLTKSVSSVTANVKRCSHFF